MGPPKSEAGKRTITVRLELISELNAWTRRRPISRLDLAFPSSTGIPLWHENLLHRRFFALQVRVVLGVPRMDDKGGLVLGEEGGLILAAKLACAALR